MVKPCTYPGQRNVDHGPLQPLTSANYTAWKDQLDLTLGYFDLDYAIRNDEPAAITENSTAEQRASFQKWDKANRLSRMTIKSSIPLGLRGAIPKSNKVKTYLKSVEDYFKGSSKAHASSLMLKMLTPKYDGSSGVREHIMKMSDMANKLKTLEMEVSDNFLVHFIMTSLPAQFDPFKINYNAQKDKWKMSELIAMCQQEKDHIKLEKPEAVHFTTTANSKKRKGNNSNKTGKKASKISPGAVASSSNVLNIK
uniref:uncharacterized protein LOC122596874 n=1 Tax=Erigeron canadensis TaxID=72917 RepID=UPI001CB96E3B|nr:uncharacterized protein LOC122596874 [Erigeron canadensis]